MESAPLSEANPVATAVTGTGIEVFGGAGRLDDAFGLLERLMTMAAGREITVPYVRQWPGFDPHRRDPRLEPLLLRFATN